MALRIRTLAPYTIAASSNFQIVILFDVTSAAALVGLPLRIAFTSWVGTALSYGGNWLSVGLSGSNPSPPDYSWSFPAGRIFAGRVSGDTTAWPVNPADLADVAHAGFRGITFAHGYNAGGFSFDIQLEAFSGGSWVGADTLIATLPEVYAVADAGAPNGVLTTELVGTGAMEVTGDVGPPPSGCFWTDKVRVIEDCT